MAGQYQLSPRRDMARTSHGDINCWCADITTFFPLSLHGQTWGEAVNRKVTSARDPRPVPGITQSTHWLPHWGAPTHLPLTSHYDILYLEVPYGR